MNILRHAVSAAIAVGLMYASVPLLPTVWLIKPIRLTVDGNVLQFYRDVTVPMRGDFRLDVVRGREVLPECSAYGSTLFEDRQWHDPVVYTLPCDLTDGEYDLTLEVAAVGPFGIRLRPTSIAAHWAVGEKLEEQVIRQQLQIEEQQVVIEDALDAIGKINEEIGK